MLNCILTYYTYLFIQMIKKLGLFFSVLKYCFFVIGFNDTMLYKVVFWSFESKLNMFLMLRFLTQL